MEQTGQTPEELEKLIQELSNDGLNTEKIFSTLSRAEKRSLNRKLKGKKKYGFK